MAPLEMPPEVRGARRGLNRWPGPRTATAGQGERPGWWCGAVGVSVGGGRGAGGNGRAEWDAWDIKPQGEPPRGSRSACFDSGRRAAPPGRHPRGVGSPGRTSARKSERGFQKHASPTPADPSRLQPPRACRSTRPGVHKPATRANSQSAVFSGKMKWSVATTPWGRLNSGCLFERARVRRAKASRHGRAHLRATAARVGRLRTCVFFDAAASLHQLGVSRLLLPERASRDGQDDPAARLGEPLCDDAEHLLVGVGVPGRGGAPLPPKGFRRSPRP